jgi:hypothetical protein
VAYSTTQDQAYDNSFTLPTVKQSAIRIMVWGCIMKGRKGPLTLLHYPGGPGGGMTARRYIDQVLEPHVAPFIQKVTDETWNAPLYQQDGASSHRAKLTKVWLDHHDIDIFPHPAMSPDLSPVERMWFLVKAYIRRLARRPRTRAELVHAIQEAWESISDEQVERLCDMQGRIRAVLRAKGGHTRY